SSLTKIEIPDSVTSIGEYAFFGCSSLTKIEIPDSVTSIGEYAFFGCSSLTEIKVPDSVTSIGYGAFYQYADSMGNYYGCTIVLYGLKINLPSLYHSYHTEFDGWDFEDKHEYNDAAWEHYNNIAESVDDRVINELNMILERDFGALKTKGYIYDENEEEQYDEDEPDYEKARLAMKDVYGIIVGMFNAYPDDERISTYISENVMKFLPYILENATSEAIQKMLDNGKIFTEDNINEVLDYVIKNGNTEMNAVFLNYKHEHFGFDDPLKDFVL
ncbi:MAG: leucine-rich repeat protein, partial [Ruminococcus sp.]|nr:leucine-rich repeat protein [Ruminococcus sp.]